METKFSKGQWKQRRLRSEPILVRDEDTGNEWYHNQISITDGTGRVICDVTYKTISPNEGWGHNETIEKWEANANLIAAAPKMFNTLDLIANMEEDRGRSGCTYGDTEYDSESAAYGYNQCLEYVKSIAEKAIKKASE